MSLPTYDEIQQVLNDRPNDALYAEVKPQVAKVSEKEHEITAKIMDLVLNDMAYDFAVANSLDEVGKVLEYLAQENQIEPPEFTGDMLMKSFSRIAKLKLSLDFADLVGVSGQALDAVLKAEVERLWGDTHAAALKKLLLSKTQSNNTVTTQKSVDTGVKEHVIPK
jgi:hypothetical protein